MKAPKYILIIAAGLLILSSNTVLARPAVSVSIGSDNHSSRNSHRKYYKRDSYKTNYRHHYNNQGWCRRNSRTCRRVNVLRSVYRYDRDLGYCVAVAPMIIEQPRVIVSTNPSIVLQPQQFDENTLQLNIQLQQRKIEFLDQVLMPDKEQRIDAIRQLAGFSFDDKVRNVLEGILLTESDAELRKEAAQALGKTNNIKVLAALKKARVEDSDKDVRKAADEAIKQLEGN